MTHPTHPGVSPFVSPLPQYLAEAWLRRHFPDTAETRDVAAEWRSRTGLSARQISYFQRVGLPYDPQWNRGYAAQVQEAHMLQVRRPM